MARARIFSKVDWHGPVEIDRLRPNPDNRQLSQSQLKLLVESYKMVGALTQQSIICTCENEEEFRRVFSAEHAYQLLTILVSQFIFWL